MPAESQQTVESTDPARQSTILLAVLLYSAWFIYTHRAKHSGALWGHRFAAQFAAWVCQRIGQACGLTFTVKFDSDAADLSTGTRGMIATVGPHGVFPLATLGFGTFKFRSDVGRFEDPGLSCLNGRFAGASVVFLVPLIRELILLMGVRDAARSTLKRLLAAGHSVGVNPGGIWEMVMTDSSQEALHFQRGLGFVRLAMEMGRPLLVRLHARTTCRQPARGSPAPCTPPYTPALAFPHPSRISTVRWRCPRAHSRATLLARISSSARMAVRHCASGPRDTCVSACPFFMVGGGCRFAQCLCRRTSPLSSAVRSQLDCLIPPQAKLRSTLCLNVIWTRSPASSAPMLPSICPLRLLRVVSRCIALATASCGMHAYSRTIYTPRPGAPPESTYTKIFAGFQANCVG